MVKRCRDQRRRRVVLGEVSGLGGSDELGDLDGKTRSENDRSRDYSSSAQRRHHWKTSDLFPKRFWPCALVVLGLVAVIGLLNGLDWLARQDSSLLDASTRTSLQIGKSGSVSAWFSSFLFVLSGLASIQIYALRRHRRDDYGGVYRIWLWMAGLFLLGSIHCVVDIDRLLNALIRGGTALSAVRVAQLLVGAKFLLLTSLVVRGGFELRASRGALFCVLCVWIAYSGAWALQLPFVQTRIGGNTEMYQGNLALIAGATLFLTLIIYFRFVFLHAHGLVQMPTARPVVNKKPCPAKKVKPAVAKIAGQKGRTEQEESAAGKRGKKERKTVKPAAETTSSQDSSSESNKPARTSPLGSRLKRRSAQTPETPVAKSPKPAASTKTNGTTDAVDPEIENEILQLSRKPNLSKSERRRLRKLEKRQRRAA